MEAAIESYKRTEDEKAAADPNYSRNYRGSHCFSEEVDDELLLYNLDSRLEKFGMFDTQVEQILAQTEKSMRNMKRYEGLTMNDYRYAEQAYAHQTYAALLEETSPEFVYIRGWDRLFSFHYSDVLLMAVLLLLASLLFLPEKQTGMLPILRCSKNGGGQTAAAKLGVMSVLSVGITLLFTFGVMAVYQLSCGFSDWSVPVQSIGDLRMFPDPTASGSILSSFWGRSSWERWRFPPLPPSFRWCFTIRCSPTAAARCWQAFPSGCTICRCQRLLIFRSSSIFSPSWR